MKILRWIAFALGGLAAALALLAVVVLVYASTFDAERFKTDLAQIVQDKKHRTLKFEGEVALSLWPKIGLKVGRMSLSEPNSRALFATLEGGQVSLALWPLLKRDLVIDTLSLSGVNATLVRDKQGMLNIADLLNPEAQPSTVRFEISRAALTGVKLDFRDERAGRTIVLDELNLDTGPLGNRAEGALQFSGRLTEGQAVTRVRLASGYRADLDAQRYALDNTQLALAGEAGGWSAVDGTASLALASIDLKSGMGQLENIALSLRGKHQDDNLNANFSVPKIRVLSGTAASDAMTLILKTQGPARSLYAKFDFAEVAGSEGTLEARRVTLDADGRAGEAMLRGIFTAALKLDFTAGGANLSALEGQLDVETKKLAKPLRAKLTGAISADFAHGKSAGSLNARLDETAAALQWNATAGTVPALGFDLDIDQLNIDKYLAPKPAARGAGVETTGGEGVVDVSVLKAADLNARVKIGSLQAARVKAREVKFELHSKDGVLDVAPFSASLYQGTAAGSVRVSAKGTQALAVKQTLSNVSLGPLLKDALDVDRIEGRGKLELDVSASGKTQAALRESLEGRARFEVRDGALKGLNLARVLRDLKSAAPASGTVTSRTEKTDFAELTGSLRIEKGVVKNDDLVLKSALLRGTGAGSIDVPAGRIDYLARLGVVGAVSGPEGRVLNALRGTVVPVRINGRLDAPEIRLDAAALARETVQEKAGQKVGQKLGQHVQDALKGVLTR